MSHTKAPWMTASVMSAGERVFNLQTEDGKPLGRLWGDNAVWLAEGEDIANARLIAAAPELLEACKAAMDYCTQACDPSDEHSPVDALKAAIAKAEAQS